MELVRVSDHEPYFFLLGIDERLSSEIHLVSDKDNTHTVIKLSQIKWDLSVEFIQIKYKTKKKKTQHSRGTQIEISACMKIVRSRLEKNFVRSFYPENSQDESLSSHRSSDLRTVVETLIRIRWNIEKKSFGREPSR